MWHRALAAGLLTLAIVAGSSRLFAEEQDQQPPQTQDEYYDLLKLFVETFNEVDRNYVKSVSRRELMEAAIDGMLSKLDRHSDYIAPAEIDEFRRDVESEYGGIGIHVSIKDDEPLILGPVVGSPAYRAGLVADDVIIQIDEKPTKGLTLDQTVAQMKGKLGSDVKLTIRHSDDSEEEFTLRRENVRIKTVKGERRKADDSWNYLYDDDRHIAYIRITTFSRHTVRELRKVMNELTEHELNGLMLDLRWNPGGLLSAAIEVSDMFVEDGLIVSTTGRNIETREWKAHKAGTYAGFPMVVLVNRFSASASEIVAACLQDQKRAVVVGQRTWGKGSVQNVLRLEEGRSALKLTTAEYRRPSGKGIHRADDASEDDEWGVKPNEGLEIKLTDIEAMQLDRFRRNRDLLRELDPDEEMVEDEQLQLAVKRIKEMVAAAEAKEPVEE
jgi:carboxyl-terminal processing protease